VYEYLLTPSFLLFVFCEFELSNLMLLVNTILSLSGDINSNNLKRLVVRSILHHVEHFTIVLHIVQLSWENDRPETKNGEFVFRINYLHTIS